MYKPASVIASFRPDGGIRPLWIGVSLKNKNEKYKVCDYVQTSARAPWHRTLSFICQTQEAATHKAREFKIYFEIDNHLWYIIINNSAV